MIKSYDETFGQDVYARTSYTNDDFVYQAKFHKPYRFNREGQMEIVLEDVKCVLVHFKDHLIQLGELLGNVRKS